MTITNNFDVFVVNYHTNVENVVNVRNDLLLLSEKITNKLKKTPDQLISKILKYFGPYYTMNKENFEALKINDGKSFTTKWFNGNHGLLCSLTSNSERPWMKKEQQKFGSIIHTCLDPKNAKIIWLSPIWREAIDNSAILF
jgi:hypothetical protein